MTDSGSSDIYDIIKAIRNLSEKKKEPYKNSLYNEMYITKVVMYAEHDRK